MTFEKVLESVGEFGLFQKRTLMIVCCSYTMFGVLSYSVLFNLTEPRHRCRIDKNDTYAVRDAEHNESIYQRIPLGLDGQLSVCKIYKEPLNVSEKKPESCDGYVYDKSEGVSSLVTQFDLVCDMQRIAATITTMNFVGRLVGSLLFGILADRYGRKTTLVAALATMVAASAVGIAPNPYVYMVCRFVVGSCLTGSFDCCFVIVLEFVGTRQRTIVSSIASVFWSVGYMTISCVAFFIRDWQYLQITVTVSAAIVMLLVAWLVPESPRWLLLVDRRGKAETVLRDASRINGRPFPEDTFAQMNHDKDSELAEENGNLKDLLKNKVLLKRLVSFCLVWVAVDVGYYGASLGSGSLFGGIYVNNFLSSTAEIPGDMFSFVSVIMGRKKACMLSVVLGGTGLLIAGLVQLLFGFGGGSAIGWTVVAISLVGKVGVSSGYCLLYTWTSESVPTAYRNLVLGLCSTVSGLGAIVTPFLVELDPENKVTSQAVSSIALGGLLIISLVAILFLPETNKSDLPDTVKEAVEIGTVGVQEDTKTYCKLEEGLEEEANA